MPGATKVEPPLPPLSPMPSDSRTVAGSTVLAELRKLEPAAMAALRKKGTTSLFLPVTLSHLCFV